MNAYNSRQELADCADMHIKSAYYMYIYVYMYICKCIVGQQLLGWLFGVFMFLFELHVIKI